MSAGTRHTTVAGVLIEVAGEGVYLAKGPTVPTDGTAGYAPGCVWIDTDAAAGSRLLCNDGSITSCDFDLVSVA